MTKRNDPSADTAKLDDAIREALADDDPELARTFDNEQSFPEEIFATFRGRRRWLNLFGVLYSLAAMALAFYCLFQFRETDSLKAAVGWSLGIVLCFLVVIALKVWYWLELHRNATMRELKRVELQLAHLTRKRG